ncbi:MULTISPECIES: ribonuclease HI family protein [Thermodesulfovibrio]|jgi:ribonuclease HI|uniref:ribonuclease HI family protein n=1 Tax=Thermodesulfovibrio TaxID=28261 RepID=UPI00261F4F7F|nr:ribonuclease HI family protein [Thermodesulfovibrio sp.]
MKGKLYCDGASRGNPGEAGVGCLLIYDNERVEVSEYIGKATNNVAEYTALIRGLQEALRVGISSIEIFLDSELIVLQLKGVYRIKNKNLLPFYNQAIKLLSEFKNYEIFHIPRENNSEADKLAKLASHKV